MAKKGKTSVGAGVFAKFWDVLGEGFKPQLERFVASAVHGSGAGRYVPNAFKPFLEFAGSAVKLPEPFDTIVKEAAKTLASDELPEITTASRSAFEARIKDAIATGGVVVPTTRSVITGPANNQRTLKEDIPYDDPRLVEIRQGRPDRERNIRWLVQKMNYLARHPNIDVRNAGKNLEKAMHTMSGFYLCHLAQEEALAPQIDQAELDRWNKKEGDSEDENVYEEVKKIFHRRPIIEWSETVTGQGIFTAVEHLKWEFEQLEKKMQLATEFATGLVKDPWLPSTDPNVPSPPAPPQFTDNRNVAARVVGTALGNPTARAIEETGPVIKVLIYLAILIASCGALYWGYWIVTRTPPAP